VTIYDTFEFVRGSLRFEPAATGLKEPLILGPLTMAQVDAIHIEVTAMRQEMRRIAGVDA
jgi:hypothetical protein